MPFIQRYSDVKKGGITFTGNTLGLSKASNQNAPGTEGSIGAFTSLNATLQAGTFGNRNANVAVGANTSACRQGWDITAVDVSDKLAASQSGAVIRFTSDGDLYVPNALALLIDSKGANIVITKSADKTFADVGEEITYTLVLQNTGTVDALNVTLNDMLPPETTLTGGSVTVDETPYAGTLPVIIPIIAPEQTVTVTFKVTVNSLPAVNPVFNIARADYEFFPFTGYPATSFSNSNPAAVFIIVRRMTNVKSVDKTFAVKGDILTYTSVITNTGSIPVTDVVFKDDIPAGTTFVNGSVTINGISYPAYNPSKNLNKKTVLLSKQHGFIILSFLKRNLP